MPGTSANSEADLAYAFQFLRRRFARLIWAPGNHELWAPNGGSASFEAARGEARYMALVALARSFGVLTPEDPYPIWPGSEPPIVIAPLFTLYDYSFRPDDVAITDVVEWAAEDGIMSADELMLDPAPYPDRIAWCASRVAKTAARLDRPPGSLCLDLGQPLSAGAGPRRPAPHTTILALVRDSAHVILAQAISRRGRGVRSPPYPTHLRTRQGAFPRSLIGLSGTVGAARDFGFTFPQNPLKLPLCELLASKDWNKSMGGLVGRRRSIELLIL